MWRDLYDMKYDGFKEDKKTKIIHASGKVRVDILTSKGIYDEETKTQTHTLCLIKRISK